MNYFKRKVKCLFAIIAVYMGRNHKKIMEFAQRGYMPLPPLCRKKLIFPEIFFKLIIALR